MTDADSGRPGLLWVGSQVEFDRELTGGKAFSLNLMHGLGLPVPPAFVLTTEVCRRYHADGNVLPADAASALRDAIEELQRITGRKFGDETRPLLVSVRSGATRSMPGMMDTVLNLGVNPQVTQGLRQMTDDSRYAEDTHRRFIEQFERVVGHAPPDDPWEQLSAAVEAVFRSWNSSRAVSYRRHHGIPDDGGTAVTVQAMVFGNLDEKSGTGVLFTRNPLTGDRAPLGEWLPRGQGEDVVSGRFDPLPLSQLASFLPAVYDELHAAAEVLERAGRDAQDIEYTVESGRLWLLQTRAANRSPEAAPRIAVSLCEDGIITPGEAIGMVSAEQLEALQRPGITAAVRAEAVVLARGEPACPGIARGRVVCDTDQAQDLADDGTDVVLARASTDPEDVATMIAAVAIVTEIGGSTSHAAVVSRELGRPCVVGCGSGTLTSLEGREVTVDGTTGEVFGGALDIDEAADVAQAEVEQLKKWVSEFS